jgi:hypothetical protein
VFQVKDGGREWTGRFISQACAELRGDGGGRACELRVEGGRQLPPTEFQLQSCGATPWGESGGEKLGGRVGGGGRIRGVEGENKRGGAGWLSSLIHLSGPSRVN